VPARSLQSPRPPAAQPAPAPPVALDRVVADAVAARIGAARFTLWFVGHTRFVGLGSELVVVSRNESTRDWLEHTFGEAVRAAASDAAGAPLPVRWAVDADAFSEGQGARGKGQEEKPEPAAPVPTCPLPLAPRRSASPSPQKDLFGDPVAPKSAKSKRPDPEAGGFDLAPRAGRRWKKLDDFVVGPCNRVAHASAASVVEDPGQGANPLVLHGPTGVGKTHLLEGIVLGMRRGGERPCYVTAEEFTTRFVQASRLGKMGAFRRQFRECSALLLDNLNFLATKRATQEEFLNTFDALVSDGRQVVVTTDCHPRLADDLMPELADRLLGGAVWGLLPPDPETRLGILRKKAMAPGPPVPDAVLKFLSSHLRGNVRELEGAVNSVRHYAKVTGRPADVPLAREALGICCGTRSAW